MTSRGTEPDAVIALFMSSSGTVSIIGRPGGGLLSLTA
jgi:hypothetical protein